MDEVFTRSFSIDRAQLDEAERTAELSFSSEAAVQDRFYGPPTVLLHESAAVNLKPLREVGALLLNHDVDQIVGVPTGIEIDEESRKGRARVRFDEDAEGERAWSKVRSGSLRGVSVRFSVEKAQVIGEDENWKTPSGREFAGPLEVATRWTPREISLTPVPADAAVGVGRTERKETQTMRPEIVERLRAHGLEPENFADEDAAAAVLERLDTEASRTPESAPEPTPEPVPDPEAAARAAVAAERSRVRELGEIADLVSHPELARKWIDAGTMPDDARKEALALRASENPPALGPAVELERDEVDKRRSFVECGILARNGVEEPADGADYPAQGLSLLQAARLLTPKHQRAPEYSPSEEHFRRAFAHSSGHFTSVLENIVNKSMAVGFVEADTTYEAISYRRDVPDFKQASRASLGEFENFTLVPELYPIPESGLSDTAEKQTLATYGRKFSIGRQALLNDDQGAITQIPQRFAAAAARTINAAVYDVLSGSQTMAEDSVALFATTHTSGSNLGTAGALAVGTLGELQKLMRLQKGLEAAATLNIRGVSLVVPAALELTAAQLIVDSFYPATAAIVPTASMRALNLIVEPYLDGKSATAYYIVADPRAIDTIEVLRLQGQTGPGLSRLDGHDVLGVSWAAYVDFSCTATQHRGMAKNAGA